MTNTNLTPTPALTSMFVLGRTRDAVYLRLPRELQRPTGGCDCEHCRRDPSLAMWDTLVVPTVTASTGRSGKLERYDHTWTVHLPDPAVRAVFARFAQLEAQPGNRREG